ncbi:RnfABCDGE type electron transport complex subunit G [Solemya velum gill symbiont]|uniref:RnfABCDGE type electron transport complex subunit G n=1 Tax=Solemya velum gill symbiont TaxID=2340 RepID=UPI000997EDDD|nr:RnfABCDGE type electron transport complex subunit G [Solemya velum gill symbiont]OOY59694.1 FMN-binding protein [Solemya velum gill symbiont]OOY75140.1 FMN-binding protein [Solemya velum gill symbiont]OOY78113.1 FMN-binding protein [Solemya velum gill symbiont]OOY79528.1 FMN-binding protein [Solemya velum gill symbiont]OOY82345.1 FMN-binding protein [Solemya velum gill symbiont]
MSVNPQVDRAHKTTSTAMILTLGLVTALSGFLVVFVYQATKPVIAENKRLAIEQAVLQVIPGAESFTPMLLTEDALVPVAPGIEGTRVYAGYDGENSFIGLAAEGAAQGYADIIQLIYGYKPACECVTGIKVIKLAETPGLGDKIITDKNFVANFDALDVRLNSDATALANAVVLVKKGSKTNPWEVDAITGATISSNAVAKAINASAQQLLPQIQPYLEELEGAQP